MFLIFNQLNFIELTLSKCLGNAMTIVSVSHHNLIARNGKCSMFNIDISFIELVVNIH